MNRTASVHGVRVIKFLLLPVLLSPSSCHAEVTSPDISRPVAATKIEPLASYVGDEMYSIVDVDVNRDGVLDKIVSSAHNRGDELIFFLNTGSGYTKALESTNLTEDGGRILGEIGKATGVEHPEEVLSIETYFPKGTNVATHYISYTGTDWVLARTVYEVADWRVPGNIVYRCEVKQNIPMQALVDEESGISRFRQIPDEASRDQLCTKEQR